jgi:hypothetical protein
VAAGVVALPQAAQRVLAADVPDLEVQVRQRYRGDVLADCGDGFQVGVVRAAVDGADLLEEGGFAGVVEAEEEDGVFCDWWG